MICMIFLYILIIFFFHYTIRPQFTHTFGILTHMCEYTPTSIHVVVLCKLPISNVLARPR